MDKSFCIGIDTSNYKTSVAVVDENGEMVYNIQNYLDVKKGERGLRQSVALFQHVNQLPTLIEEVLQNKEIRDNISIVSVSSKPRPVEGSYMPVFNAGISAGKTLAAAFGAKYFEFSHQEGHIEAVKFYSPLRDTDNLISFHFSGGTTESLLLNDREIKIIGGSKDISFGQLLDRIGVALAMTFPCGEEMDNIALNTSLKENILPEIKVSDGYINLSGIETKCQRLIGTIADNDLVYMIFQRIGQTIVSMVNQLRIQYKVNDFLFAGGVASSEFIRQIIKETLPDDIHLVFGEPALSTDNAVGTALLGRKQLWP